MAVQLDAVSTASHFIQPDVLSEPGKGDPPPNIYENSTGIPVGTLQNEAEHEIQTVF